MAMRYLAVAIGALLLRAPVPTALLPPHLDVGGYYFLQGPEAAAFPEVAWIELGYRPAAAGTPGTLYGVLRLNELGPDGSSVELDLRPKVQGLRLRFESEPHAEVSYAFDGQFLKAGVMWNAVDSEEIVLHGKLDKRVRGVTKTSAAVELSYFAGD
jgi:hypothetical protein